MVRRVDDSRHGCVVSGRDTIFVCPGTYVEPAMFVTKDNVTIVGPAATNGEVSGTAIVRRNAPHNGDATFTLSGSGDVISGLDIDGA